MGWIYKITCQVTGKVYIGQTVQDVQRRWEQHRVPCKWTSQQTHLARAVRMYGWNNFRFEVVCQAADHQLDRLEIEYIAQHDSYRNGLNSTTGGSMRDMMKLPEQRAMLSKLCVERCKDPAHMQKRAEGTQRYLDTLTEEKRRWVIDRMLTPEATAKRVASLKATLATPIGKTTKSNATKAAWANPESRERRMKALKEAAGKRRNMATERTCKDCGCVKPRADFPGRSLRCKKCTSARVLSRRRAANGSMRSERTIPALQKC